MNYIVTPDQVREWLVLNSPGSSSKYSDETVGSNIRAAQSYLERECRRYFYDHPGVTWSGTTLLQAQVALPGFRSFTSCTWGATIMDVAIPGDGKTSPSAWGILEPTEGLEDGQALVVGIQFRPWRVDGDRPWYYADSQWWDKALDSPFYPGNYGGGYAWTSMPNDLIIVGDGGYEPGNEPWAVRQVVKTLAGWNTLRPASVLAGMANTGGGGSLSYTELPAEVLEFISDWKLGTQAQSAG